MAPEVDVAPPQSTERRPLISGNWKMHHNHFEAIQAIQKLSWLLNADDLAAVEVSVHPPFTDLRSLQTILDVDKINIALGAQNCYFEDKGAFTGEVSPLMLAKLDVRYVIVGHSERREIFGEDDKMVNAKVRAVIAAGMKPILCVGESLSERDAGTTEDKVATQLRSGLAGVAAEALATIVVAYEPIWAIGTGRNATPEDAQSVCASLRDVLRDIGSADAADAIRVQYGGSVKPGNISDLMAQPDIDGALVGGASLDPEQFAGICRYPAATRETITGA
ncbi:MAG: triose-phosphate isomerase [Acidimicrobiales bacterium]